MEAQEKLVHLVFYYVNGQTETFTVPGLLSSMTSVPHQDLQQAVRQFLKDDWWILHLPEHTVCIHVANVIKFEIKSPMVRFEGEGVLANVQRVTALSHAR